MVRPQSFVPSFLARARPAADRDLMMAYRVHELIEFGHADVLAKDLEGRQASSGAEEACVALYHYLTEVALLRLLRVERCLSGFRPFD